MALLQIKNKANGQPMIPDFVPPDHPFNQNAEYKEQVSKKYGSITTLYKRGTKGHKTEIKEDGLRALIGEKMKIIGAPTQAVMNRILETKANTLSAYPDLPEYLPVKQFLWQLQNQVNVGSTERTGIGQIPFIKQLQGMYEKPTKITVPRRTAKARAEKTVIETE